MAKANIGVSGTLAQMDRALNKHQAEVEAKRERVERKVKMPARTFRQMCQDGTVSNY